MKGKLSTKTIIIAIITIVLLAVAVTGTVLFLKDSGEAAAVEEQQNVLLPVAGSDSQEETNAEQKNNNEEVNSETSIGANQTEDREQTTNQSQGATTTTPTQTTGTITEEPEATTVQREKTISEETTLGWNNLLVSSLNTDYTEKNINYNNLKYRVEYYYDGEIDNTKTINGTAPEGTIVTLVEKLKEGYTKYDYSKDTEIKDSQSENIFRVYYGKPNVSIVKSAPTEVSYGESIHYKIKITNSGYLGTTVTVTDELKGTIYKENSATPAYKNKTTNTSGNTVLTWEINIPAATENGNAVKNIEFDVDIPTGATLGTIYKNTATSKTTQEQTSSSETETKIKELDVKFDEWREGKEGKDLNIIFLIDNSSSMNEPTANNTYVNNDAIVVAPSDRTKTRMESAKSAIQSFITSESNDTMTVIKYNKSTASANEEVVKLTGTGYTVSELKSETTGYGLFARTYYYYEVDIDGSTLKLYEYDNYSGELNGKEYVLATDGKCYEYNKTQTAQGPQVVGTTIPGKIGATNNSGLNTAVSNMTIGDLRSSFSTYVNPAFSKAADYIVNEKTNVVIVLSDGAFDDYGYKNAAETLRKSGADYIYSVAFGANADKNKLKAITNVYEKDKNGNDTENKKVYEASDSSTLLNEFRAIKASASGKQQNKSTQKGKVTFNPASNTIQVKENCPIIAYITGTTTKLFESYDVDELKSKYGIEIASDGKTLTWDANAFIANNQDKVPEIINGDNKITIKYYIKNSN